MSYNAIMKVYLKALQNQYKNAMNSGQYTAELSYRMPLDAMEKALAREFNPNEEIDVILEPTTQGRVGRPDWRIHITTMEYMDTLREKDFQRKNLIQNLMLHK